MRIGQGLVFMVEPNPEERRSLPSRSHPARGVRLTEDQPIIVFLTVCTKSRLPWLANEHVHKILIDVWVRASAWAVGRYVVMPDHVHLFVGPNNEQVSLDSWVKYWKSQVSRRVENQSSRWQKDYWDTRLRNPKSYGEKWAYVRDNPVRHGLVNNAIDWPYQGELNDLEM